MAQFVSVEARRLISFLAVCARATCCMQHLSRQRSLPPQSIFVPLQLELQLHLRHSLQVRHLPHLIPKQRGPFWGQCSMYKHAYVCVYVHTYICMYSAYVRMYYTHECYNNFLNTFVYFSFAFRVCFILWRYQNFTLRIWRARHLF